MQTAYERRLAVITSRSGDHGSGESDKALKRRNDNKGIGVPYISVDRLCAETAMVLIRITYERN